MPLRCPTVKRWMPACCPTGRPPRRRWPPADAVGRALLHEPRVRVVSGADEAELLALALARAGDAARDGFGAHLGLGALAERKDEPRQAIGGGRVEEVALILLGVLAREEVGRPVRIAADARVVPRRHRLRAEAVGDREELAQLHLAVARGAGAGRLPAEVGVDERGDDLLGEQRATVEREMRKAEGVRRPARVVLVLGRAAAPVGAGIVGLVGVVPEVERDADDVVALVLEARGGDGGVDPAAHRHHDPPARAALGHAAIVGGVARKSETIKSCRSVASDRRSGGGPATMPRACPENRILRTLSRACRAIASLLSGLMELSFENSSSMPRDRHLRDTLLTARIRRSSRRKRPDRRAWRRDPPPRCSGRCRPAGR